MRPDEVNEEAQEVGEIASNGAKSGLAQPNPPTPDAIIEQLSSEVDNAAWLPADTRRLWFFAYDILLDPAYISRYVRGLIPERVVYAPHQRLAFPHYHPPEQGGLPTLSRSFNPGDRVWGVLFDAKPASADDGKRDFRPLDRHLNVPGRYHRKSLHVLDRGGRRFTAFTYVLSLDDGGSFAPSENYLSRWLQSARDRLLPEDWLDYLKGLRSGETAQG